MKMTGSSISILGLYQFDPTIFDNLQLPYGLDKDELVSNILIEGADLEVLYPNADFIKAAIGSWSAIRLSTWKRMQAVLGKDYDPFINIKRDEVRTIEQSRNLFSEASTTDQVSAFNETSFSNRSKNSGNSKDTGNVLTKETFHLEGDSAITDAQDVLRKEMEVRIRFDMYRIIIDEFRNRFLILVY